MRLMYDGIMDDVPAIRRLNPRMVAGYVDGRYAWSSADWKGWPKGCITVKIAVFHTTNEGDVIDCENGDATPDQAAQWVRMRKAHGYFRPTINCSRSAIPAVRQATGNLILGKDYDIWVADWTGAAHQVPGCPATQYKAGKDFDTSMVYDDKWPHSSNPNPPQVKKVISFISATIHYTDGTTKLASWS